MTENPDCEARDCTKSATETHGGEVWFCADHFDAFRRLALEDGKTWEVAMSVLCD